MTERVIQPSFAAGEISPSLYARVDLAKYRVGAATLRNFFIDYRGGASSRPGTQFIGQCKAIPGQPRLIPFIVSTLATYVIEFGDFYCRFISNGAYVMSGLSPLEVVSPYAVTDLPLVKYAQSADVLTLTHPSYPVYNLTRTSPTSFSLVQDVIAPVQQPPTSVVPSTTFAANTDTTYGYVVTSVSLDGKEESLPTFPAFQSGQLLGGTTSNNNMNILHWTAPAATPAQYYNVYRVGSFRSRAPTTGTAGTAPTVYGYIGQSTTTTFTDNNIAADFTHTPPQFQDPFSPGQIAQITVSGGGGSYTTQYIIGLIITDSTGTGASGYAVIDANTSTPVGVVITSPGRNYTAPHVTDSVGAATYAATLGQQSGTYPAAVGYFQQRRVFGGTDNFPETFVCSQPGNYENFDTTPTSTATDAITASIASLQVNAIKSFTAMSTGLVILTSGAGFLVSGGNQNAAITPADVVAFPQASSGANDLPPLKVNNDILYCQNRGAVVRDLAFNFYTQSYLGTDRSLLASHLFFTYTLQEWTYAEEPWRIVPTVRNDGTLLMFTYVLDQEVFAWTHYDTNGAFRSVASIPEGQTNAVYVIVQRFVENTYVYYVERFDPRLWTNAFNTWCVDSALTLPETFPNASVFPSGSTGTINLLASAPVFSAGNVGDTFWAGGGQATITAFVNSTNLTAQVLIPLPTFPNDPFNLTIPYTAGQWSLDTPVTTISGLDHLDGLEVCAVCDGVPQPPITVQAGSIPIPASTKVVAGLPFTCQLQTLRLDVGDPTIQGKRKNIPAVTVRLNLTAPFYEVGPDFTHLVPAPQFQTNLPFTPPSQLFTGDQRINMLPSWNKEGQICIQQSDPVPITVLGVIPEVIVGDTAK